MMPRLWKAHPGGLSEKRCADARLVPARRAATASKQESKQGWVSRMLVLRGDVDVFFGNSGKIVEFRLVGSVNTAQLPRRGAQKRRRQGALSVHRRH